MRRFPNRRDRGQSTAEFALAAPVLILLLFGLTLAAFYAFRAAAADWGIFVIGIAEGSFEGSAANQARNSVVWPDIASSLTASGIGVQTRQVRSEIMLSTGRPWIFEVDLREHHRASAFFRLWRFYAGPPAGGIE